jgi:hypothetical protein
MNQDSASFTRSNAFAVWIRTPSWIEPEKYRAEATCLPELDGARRASDFGLSLLIEARADQYDTKNQSTAAKEGRDDVRRAFRGLKFQISHPRHVLSLLGRKDRDCETDQTKNNENRSDNR